MCKPGVTWSFVTSGSFSVRYLPDGFICDVAGSAIFPNTDDILGLTALCNSKIATVVLQLLNPTINMQASNIASIPVKESILKNEQIEHTAHQCISLSQKDWNSFETSWDFTTHPLVRCASFSMEEMAGDLKHHIHDMNFLKEALVIWRNECYIRFIQLKANEEELNRIFIDIYGLQDELTPEVADKDVTVHRIFDTKDEVPGTMRGSNYVLTKRDGITSLLSYAVGCMFGRYSLDVPGLAYAGGEWDAGKYSSFQPDADNIIPLTDETYLEDDIVSRLCQWLLVVYGPDTLEENLDFIAKALGNKGATSREVIRNYFLKDFFADHCKVYQKRPIYWPFDSGKQNGFKALVYLHRYTPDTIGKLRVDYLHRLQRVYASEIERMQDMIDNSRNPREVATSTKRKEKLQKQLKECREYDEKIAHLALARIELDLDDGVKVNYRKVQTASDGKLYEVLADSKNIMGKQ